MRRWVLMILAVVLYNSWLAWPLNGSPDALLAYISELAAADQPFSWFFRAADAAAATVYGVIAFLGWHGWTRWLGRRHSRHVSLALLTVAAGTMLDVSFNLPCAESRDLACAAMPSIKRHLHEVASVIVSAGQVACIALVAWARARRGWTRAVRAMTGLAAVVAVLLVASAAMPLVLPGAQGPVQIVQILLCSGWIGYLAWQLPSSHA